MQGRNSGRQSPDQHRRTARRSGLTSRRTLLSTGAAGVTFSLAGCLGGIGGSNEGSDPPEVDHDYEPDGELTWDGESQFDTFVDTDGTDFVVDGERIYFNGTNKFGLGMSGTGTVQKIDSRLPIYEEHGFNALRTWAFGEGEKLKQTAPGEYDEEAFTQLDYLIAKAGEHGLRLIMPLADYWTHFGGMRQYEAWSSTLDVEFETGGIKPSGQFYRNEEAQQLYRDYVEYVLTRENTFTGRKYSEEPAIAMWEVSNEPRLRWSSAQNNIEVLHQWIEDTASLISKHADKQLVSTGMEGFFNRENPDGWTEDGSQGTDFVQNHSINEIDACSVHMYPQSWGKSPDWSLEWIKEHATAAHEEVGKPVYLGEFGWKADRITGWDAQSKRRREVLQQWYDALDKYDVNGAFYWQIDSARTSPSEHTLKVDDDAIEIVDQYTERVRKKSEAEW